MLKRQGNLVPGGDQQSVLGLSRLSRCLELVEDLLLLQGFEVVLYEFELSDTDAEKSLNSN